MLVLLKTVLGVSTRNLVKFGSRPELTQAKIRVTSMRAWCDRRVTGARSNWTTHHCQLLPIVPFLLQSSLPSVTEMPSRKQNTRKKVKLNAAEDVPSAPTPKPRVKGAKLAELTKMPLDVLFEVLSTSI